MSEQMESAIGLFKRVISDKYVRSVSKAILEMVPGGRFVSIIIDEIIPSERDRLIDSFKILKDEDIPHIRKRIRFNYTEIQELKNKYNLTEKETKNLQEKLKNISEAEIKNAKDEILSKLNEILEKNKRLLPSLENELKKEMFREGAFFRIPVAWIDFEQGFVIEREEVNSIKEVLKKEKIAIVDGKPGAGKSIVIQHVGYKVLNEGMKVYLINPKTISKDRIGKYLESFLKYEKDSLLIIDDAHLLPYEVNGFLKEYKEKKDNYILIACREIKNYTHIIEEFKSFNTHIFTEIYAKDVSDELIYQYLRVISKKKTITLTDENIITITNNIKSNNFDKNLLLLAFALQTVDFETFSVSKEDILQSVKEYIEKNIRDIERIIVPIDILLILSIFYRYEISIEKLFLIENLGLNEEKLNCLLKLSEITESGRKVGLNHSIMAELYYETITHFRDELNSTIFHKYGSEDIEKKILAEYVLYKINESIDFIFSREYNTHNMKLLLLRSETLLDDRIIEQISLKLSTVNNISELYKIIKRLYSDDFNLIDGSFAPRVITKDDMNLAKTFHTRTMGEIKYSDYLDILKNKEKVLLIRHSFGINIGKWSIPGGYVEIGETLSEAVVREVLEETGVKTRVGGLLMLRHSTQKKDENRTISDLYLVFSLDYVEGKAVSDHFETSEANFVSINELENYNLSDLSKYILETRIKSVGMYLDEYQPIQEIVSKLNILKYEVFG